MTLAEQSARPDISGEAFNFSPESQYTVLDIVGAIGKVLGVEPDPIILDSAKSEILHQTLDASKARRLLDWSTKWDLNSGLTETVAWYRGHLVGRDGMVAR